MAGKSSRYILFLILIAIVLVLIFLLFRGCPPESVRLTVLGEDIPTTAALRALTQELQAQDPTLQVDFVLDDYETMVQKANHDLASGTGVFDVILQYNTALATYVRNNYIFTLAEYKSLIGQTAPFEFEKDLFQQAWKEVGWYKTSPAQAAEPFGVPFASNTMFLVYNKELFENAEAQRDYELLHGETLQPPTTWEGFVRVSKFFSEWRDSTYGVVLQGSPYWIYYEWANFAFGMGGGVMKKELGWVSEQNTPLLLTAPATVDGTLLYLELSEYDASEDFLSTDAISQRNRFEQGDVALAIVWSDVAYDLIAGDVTMSKSFGFLPIPGDVAMLAGGSFYINRASEHPREAFEYVLRLMEPENQVKLLKAGLCSPLVSAYQDPETGTVIPYAEALEKSLERGVYMLEAGPDADAIIVTLSNMLQDLWKRKVGGESLDRGQVAEALADAEVEIQGKRREIFEQLAQQ